MTIKHLNLTPALYEYMLDVSLRESAPLRNLREETAKLPLANMQIAPEQGQFMQLLLRLLQAKNVLEIGTFTGYSSLAMAEALPEDGKLITCDINPEWTTVARDFWQQAGQDKKIELRLAPALDSMQQLLEEGWQQGFDFIFIDADKTAYCEYYELALKLLKPQGLIAIDNVFWDGKVLDKDDHSGQTREVKRLNALIKQDRRVFTSMLPIADGLFLIQPNPSA